ncbi:MAG: InlB B-repeat-containing protein, partial [Candidatus Methanomethylophilus sp.]|nr:InlB B-repeat-containing protein [Methanomethylophilus sp.]
PADPVREGYTFSGWDPALPSTMPAGTTTYVAQWTVNTYTITFDTLGGSEVAAVSQAYGTAITAPADPTKEGFNFVKWDQEIPGTVPARDLTISAVWAANATVDETGKTEVVLDKDTDAFVLPADTKTVTVTVDDNISVVIQDTSSIEAGTAVITKVEEIPNTAEVDGTARAYEVTVTKADDQPVTGKMRVTLPYTPEKGKVPAVYWQNGSVLEKMRVISHTSDSVTFETTHNSTYVVVAESASEDSGATFMLYLGLLMVVGIALSMLVGFNYYRRKA